MPDRRLPPPSPLNARFAILAHTGVVAMEPKRKKLALLGASNRVKDWVPREDPDFEIWGLNAMVGLMIDMHGRFRADRFFEMHPRSAQSERDMAFLRVCPVPLYGLDDWEALEAPHGVRYPLETVMRSTGMEECGIGDFFSCTFAYQIALAIAEGFEEIWLCGIDLDQGSPREMSVERTAVAFWAAYAMGRGITIRTHPSSLLLWHPYRYGYDYRREAEWTNAYLSRMTADGVTDPTKRAEPSDGAILARDDITDREWERFEWTEMSTIGSDRRFMRGQRRRPN